MQVRLHVPQRLALVRARDDRRQADLGMVQQQARELATGVPGDTDDGDADGHRAIMRLNAYLCKMPLVAPVVGACLFKDERPRATPRRRLLDKQTLRVRPRL